MAATMQEISYALVTNLSNRARGQSERLYPRRSTRPRPAILQETALKDAGQDKSTTPRSIMLSKTSRNAAAAKNSTGITGIIVTGSHPQTLAAARQDMLPIEVDLFQCWRPTAEKSLVAEVKKKHGRIDILFVNYPRPSALNSGSPRLVMSCQIVRPTATSTIGR